LLYLRSGSEARWEPEREDVEPVRHKLNELSSRIVADSAFAPALGPHCTACLTGARVRRPREAWMADPQWPGADVPPEHARA
jgi:hypothetical protein